MNWVQPKFTDFIQPPSKKLKLDGKHEQSSTHKPSQSVALKRNWKPRVKGDLVVNKKKIEEVENWLVDIKKPGKASVLLLTGPPGCGKLTTLKVLCSELKINLVEWLPQIAQRKYDPENGEFYQSVSSLFEEFVVRATRYTNVLNSMSSRLIVIKDIPNSYFRDPSSFHEFLNRYSRIPGVHLAFILTDVPVIRSLFPDSLKGALNLTNIAFNPVTKSGVKDALKKLFQNHFQSFIDIISVSCNGDLRNAITAYEFSAKNGAVPSRKKKKEQTDPSDKSDFLDIFRGLGRVLYAKREDNGQLVHDPVDVGEAFVSSPELFLGMLHENYLHTYSTIHDVAKASESLSSSNMLLNDFKDTPSSRALSLVVASTGLMVNNSAPVKKFLQMNKPRRITNENLSEIRSQFSDANVMLDVVTYGRAIPSYAMENKDMLRRIKELK